MHASALSPSIKLPPPFLKSFKRRSPSARSRAEDVLLWALAVRSGVQAGIWWLEAAPDFSFVVWEDKYWEEGLKVESFGRHVLWFSAEIYLWWDPIDLDIEEENIFNSFYLFFRLCNHYNLPVALKTSNLVPKRLSPLERSQIPMIPAHTTRNTSPRTTKKMQQSHFHNGVPRLFSASNSSK
jgi:hypothetical protein